MKKIFKDVLHLPFTLPLLIFSGCDQKNEAVESFNIDAINLKRGEVILCGPAEKQFGSVNFENSCTGNAKKDFDLALALLHSFEYDEAEKVFAKIIDAEPGCAMAWWGVAMSTFHPLWAPPTGAELEKGSKAVAVAQSIKDKSELESAYINAIGTFYEDWQSLDHITRAVKFEKAMEKIYLAYPEDKEAAIFYALSLNGAADLTDKTFSKQKQAASILTSLYPSEPDHPGLIHYIIHSYDYPELAELALPAARKYASIAPSSAHAQHMPSHIFTRLGLWDENIKSNLVATAAAKCYGENTGIKGHWDEELHCLDYLVYAYLQKGDNKNAKAQVDYLLSIKEAFPLNIKVAYAFASIPSRYFLENKMWKQAAEMKLHTANLAWEKFPWQKGIFHFAKLLGNVNSGNVEEAKHQLDLLSVIHDTLVNQKDPYKTKLLEIQMKTGKAWINFRTGKNDLAIKQMKEAADLEDNIQKHPVTPGEVLPARELLADMLMEMNKPAEALLAYEADLAKHRNRFNGLYGAAIAAERSDNRAKANEYYGKLKTIADPSGGRKEIDHANLFLNKISH